MTDAKSVLENAHRDNIHRYRRLLEKPLTDVERWYVQARISEEQSALQSVFGSGATAIATESLRDV
jgi:hypothetical protein